MSRPFISRSCAALGAFVSLSACYSGHSGDAGVANDYPPIPEGYTEFLVASLDGAVSVRLAAPSQHLLDHAELYGQITVSSAALPVDNGDRNSFEFVINMEPEGLALTAPILLQATWSPSGEQDVLHAGFFTHDKTTDRWRPVDTQSIDPVAGQGSAWLKSIADTAPIYAKAVPTQVSQLSAAVVDKDFKYIVEAEPSALATYDVWCGKCDDIDGELDSCTHGDGCELVWDHPEATVNADASGLHVLVIEDGTTEKWRQYFYVSVQADIAPWKDVAEKWRPNFHYSNHHTPTCSPADQEADDVPMYWPLAIGELFKASVQLGFRNEDGFSVETFTGEAARAYMATHARFNLYLDRGSDDLRGIEQGSERVLYWHVNHADNDPSRVFVTYWALYAYDTKSPGWSRKLEHTMDRESVTIEVHCQPGQPATCGSPVAVWYSGHLPGQGMYLLDEEKGETITASWLGDSLRVPWARVEKADGRPIVYVAYGSHAMYPRKGIYFVDPVWEKYQVGDTVPWVGGTEAACGDIEEMQYKLQPLNMGLINSESNGAPFLFSGMWVDMLAAFDGERFPPFVDRFYATASWADAAAKTNKDWCNGECVDELDVVEPCDAQEDAQGSFTTPGAGSVVSGEFTASGMVTDSDNIQTISVTVDDLQACKFSSFPTGTKSSFDYNIDVDLKGCGAPSGERTLGLWVRDKCSNSRLVASRKVQYDVPVPPSCGDGSFDPSTEDCDNGSLGGETCESLGFGGGQLACTAGCAFDTGWCTAETCGDGKLNGEEACDAGEFAGGAVCEDFGHDGGTLGCTNCTIDESSCCDVAHIIENAENPSYTSTQVGCAEGGGIVLLASAKQISDATIRFYVKKSDGSAWGSDAQLYLFVGTGPTCGDPQNTSKNDIPVDVGETIQTIDLTIDPYDGGWAGGTTKEFWIGKSESGFKAGRASGTIDITRTQCE